MKSLPGLAPHMAAAGLNQNQLARLLGVSRSCVNQWLRGGTYPSVLMLPQIAEKLGCSIDDLYRLPTIPPEAEDDNQEFTTWEVG